MAFAHLPLREWSIAMTADTLRIPGYPATREKSLLPTHKWLAAVVTALGAWAVLWIQAGTFSVEVQIALAGLVTQAIVAYLVPNQDSPGGVPPKRSTIE
jgi:hypothetical protein